MAKKAPKKIGRPTKYDPKLCDQADAYLKKHADEFWTFIKGDGPKGTTYERMVHVNLPTIRGFGKFIGVQESTLYEWAKVYPSFSESLEKIKIEQEQRLLNHGLSGEYNPTIAKLILSSNHGYRERNDVTSDDKPLPQPILDVHSNHSNKKDTGAKK